MKRTKDSPRDNWDNIKEATFELQEYQEKKRKRKSMRKKFFDLNLFILIIG